MSTDHPGSASGHAAASASQQPPAAGPQNSTVAKRDLTSWWKRFNTKTARREEEKDMLPLEERLAHSTPFALEEQLQHQPQPQSRPSQQSAGIFGVPLGVSIKYANVAISLTDAEGRSFIYGYVPIVVAKCGVFLKEQATEAEGIFRLNGSAKRIRDLQTVFNSPDRYGKGLDWTGYTIHDAANILRRYLNQLPEPIIPLNFYEKFRDPLRNRPMQLVGDEEGRVQDLGDFDEEGAIKIFQELITQLPPLSRQLLLYILDLLAVFASKAEVNLMTAANLAAIFQPGVLSHPTHDMSPAEYRLSQDVLVFLIENQDHFLIGMRGTAADEDTVREVQSGRTPQASSSATGVPAWQVSSLDRSSSNASAGAESVRRYGGLRRNVSVSSKQSKHSTNAPSPVSPAYPGASTSSGVHRSNTVPSKKSPGLVPNRFNRPSDPPTPSSAALAPPGVIAPSPPADTSSPSARGEERPAFIRSASPSTSLGTDQPGLVANEPVAGVETDQSQEKLLLETPSTVDARAVSITPSRERHRPAFFARSPTSDGEKKDSRPPNKLRKKRVPGSAHQSAHSSSHSLHGGQVPPESPALYTGQAQLPTHPAGAQPQLDTISPALMHASHGQPESSAQHGDDSHDLAPYRAAGHHLRPPPSPVPSFHSHSSVTDHSDEEPPSRAGSEQRERTHRWRLSTSHKHEAPKAGSGSGPLGVIPDSAANNSVSSVGSSARPRKSTTNDSHSQQLSSEPSSVMPPPPAPSGPESGVSPGREGDVKGPLGWFKAKVREHKEERREREAEKERAKSPPPAGADRIGSRPSLSAGVESMPLRGRSVEMKREESKPAENKEEAPVSTAEAAREEVKRDDVPEASVIPRPEGGA
ncbi:MAG: hypothetical protein M1837_005165 [Sclerophora amabilis]|nr:MAG: hypothetical protein M1837_005165 [Sclerophora amabilis]